jgi:CheY-like chemotaxis protein
MKTSEVANERLLTTYDVGSLLQVDPTSVNNWIKGGRIPAFRTPGGHNRIRVADLVGFLRRHAMPIPRSLRRRARRRKLLVVDDDARELKAIVRLLKSHADSLEIRTVSQGIDALILVGRFEPDVVLLDVFMQGMDGIEVCRRLKAMDLTRAVKVVINSAHLTSEIETQATAAGAVRCVQKPVKLADLLDVLGLATRSMAAVDGPPLSPG